MGLHQALTILMAKVYLIDIAEMNGYICTPILNLKKISFTNITSRVGVRQKPE